jgi:hypothetical protein
MSMSASAAFYCVADSSYFVGAVGMLNSLRLLGHTEEVFVLDCGLTAEQRALLDPHATLVPGPIDVPPCLLKTIAPLSHPAEVMVLIDADIVATRSLGQLIERASEGRVLAIKDGEDRYFPEWGDLLGTGVPRRQPYVSSSLVILGNGPGRQVVRLMHEMQTRIDVQGSPFAARVPDRAFFRGDYAAPAASHPFFYPEQDVLNAILATEVDPRCVEVLDRRSEADPPFAGLRVVDEHTLRCAYRDGTQPYVLHHFALKPWLERTFHSPYARLLRRLLIFSDVPVRIPEGEVPLRLRTGARAWVARMVVNAYDLARWYLRDRPWAWFRRRVSGLHRSAAEGP